MARHMLLLGGARSIHPKAKKLGLKLSLIMEMPRLIAQKNQETYDRIVGIPAAATLEEWLESARLIHRIDPIDFIGGFNEVSQDQAAAIAEALDLPFYQADVIRATRQKDLMRQILREAKLDTTASKLVGGAAEIEAFGEAHGYPIVLKPVDARGSLGVSIVQGRQDIPKALEWFGAWTPGRKMLVEQFLEGEEYSVEAFSEDGLHQIICITQKFKDPTTSVETGHCLPAPLADATRVAIEQFVTAVLTALHIDRGPSHTEVIVTAAGPQIVETHTRLGGDSIPDLIELLSGVNLDEMWVRQTIGERVLPALPQRLEGVAAIQFASPRANGVLERVDGLETARAMSGVKSVELIRAVGTKVQEAYDSFSRGAYVIAVGDTHDEAIERARAAAHQLRFVVSCAG